MSVRPTKRSIGRAKTHAAERRRLERMKNLEPDVCAYCLVDAPETRDHIPPRCFFNKPLPSDLITVLSPLIRRGSGPHNAFFLVLRVCCVAVEAIVASRFISMEGESQVKAPGNSSLVAPFACAVLLSTSSSTAHPNPDLYDLSSPMELNGKVVGFELKNPHSILYVDVTHEDGTVTSWAVEGGAARGIVEAGLSKEFLASGPNVRIKAFQSIDKLCTPRCKAAGEDFEFDKSRGTGNRSHVTPLR